MKRFFLLFSVLLASILVVFGVFVKLSWDDISESLREQTTLNVNNIFGTESESTTIDTSKKPAEFDGWSFAVVGDTEDGGLVTDAILADISKRVEKKEDIRFVAHLGDVSSHGDEMLMREVKAQFEQLPVPTYFVPGNNDLVYDEVTERRTLSTYTKVFGKEVYFAQDVENAHLLFLDNSYRRTGFSDEEIAWTKKQLQEHTQPYTFLFFHRPLNVPGQELVGDDETPNSRQQNEKFLALIAEHNIARIFNGHIHLLLQYTLGSSNIPVTISGGGGAAPQDILGGVDAAYYHYLIITVPFEPGGTPHLQIVEIDA